MQERAVEAEAAVALVSLLEAVEHPHPKHERVRTEEQTAADARQLVAHLGKKRAPPV